MPSIPKPLSPGEELFKLHCRISGLNPVTEHRFDTKRKWRFDFAFPTQKLAVEIEGAIWSRGRHTRGIGYEGDMEKYNAAVLAGWRVLRYSTDMVVRGDAITDVEKYLGSL